MSICLTVLNAKLKDLKIFHKSSLIKKIINKILKMGGRVIGIKNKMIHKIMKEDGKNQMYRVIKINNLKELKANRDNGQSKFLLEQLESAAKSNDNIMPFVISCIRSKCTLGEIADVFRSTFGEYQ